MHITKFRFIFFVLVAMTGAKAQNVTPAATPRKFLVDRFGQSARVDYPGKVRSEEELKMDVSEQMANLPKIGGPVLDSFGGLAGSREQYGLEKTGFFHAGQANERLVLITPQGNVFFHNGVCGLNSGDDYTLVRGRENRYEWIPDEKEFSTAWRERTPGVVSFYIANWIRKFGRPYSREEWLDQVISRLRAWGFNSAGAFTQPSGKFTEANFPYVASLRMEAAPGIVKLPDKLGAAYLLDPFDSEVEKILDQWFAETISPKAQDSLLIGYFLGNEQHFENLPKLIPTYKGTVAAKRRLVEFLREKYQTIDAFNQSWNPAEPFASFDMLNDESLFVRTETAEKDMREYFQFFLDTYYSLVNRIFRKHDPNHMLIGSRWTPGTASNEDVVNTAGRYLDVISVNYYTYAIDKAFLHRIYNWSGKKGVILSEWYFSCADEGLVSGKEVRNQEERGSAYQNYIEQSAALPFIVGSEWFSYLDQSITGRHFEGFNGEANNIGLVNVVDRPYESFISKVRQTNERIYDVMFGIRKPFQFTDSRFNDERASGEPRVATIPRALNGLRLDGTTVGWPGRPSDPIESSRLASGTPNPQLRGDFRACWDDNNLYFYIQVKDATPLRNSNEGGALWKGDCVELFLGSNDAGKGSGRSFGDRQILLGAAENPKIHVLDHPADSVKCRILAIRDVAGDGYVLVATIPLEILGFQPTTNQEFLFDVAIDNSDDGLLRKQQLVWNGNSNNSGDRGAWGRARLTEN